MTAGSESARRGSVQEANQVEGGAEVVVEGQGVIISDNRMPGSTAHQALENVQHGNGATPVTLITAVGDAETHVVERQ